MPVDCNVVNLGTLEAALQSVLNLNEDARHGLQLLAVASGLTAASTLGTCFAVMVGYFRRG